MSDHFSVGLAFEYIAGRLQFGAQFVVVFDNAVVNQGNACRPFALSRKMGMGIVGGGRAMRGPTGMGDTGKTLYAVFGHLGFKFGYTLGAAGAAYFAVCMHCDPDVNVATAFQTLKDHKDVG